MTHVDLTLVTPTLAPDLEDLERCLASVAAQTGAEVEHVIVDGGSLNRAGVEEVARRFGVRVRDDERRGQSSAINLGVRVGSGFWVGWLGADDRLTDGSVARAIRAGDRAGADWVVGRCLEVEQPSGRRTHLVPPRGSLSERDFRWGSPVPQPGAIVRRTVWDAVGGLDERFHYTMDTDLWVRLLRSGRAPATLRDVLAVFVRHADSKSVGADPGLFAAEGALAFAQAGWTRPAGVAVGKVQGFAEGEPSEKVASLLSAAVAALPQGVRAVDVAEGQALARLLSSKAAPRAATVRDLVRHPGLVVPLSRLVRRRIWAAVRASGTAP